MARIGALIEMKKQITPQEKKIQSYVSDRRNMYGESRSSAIKSIRKQKAIVNRHYRRTSAEQLRAGKKLNEPDEISATIHCIKRKRWKKCPDNALVEYIECRWQRRLDYTMQQQRKASQLMQEAKRRLRKREATL